MTYNQYEATPNGLNYLTGDIMPWHDYIIFRSNEHTSVAVYGIKSEDLTWEDATVRTVSRSNNMSQYQVTESKYDSVTVNIDNPYYAYGNVIGVSYDLPSSCNITCMITAGFFALTCLIQIFRTVWTLKRGTVK